MIADEARELSLRVLPFETPVLQKELDAMGPARIEDVTPPTARELNGSLLDAWKAINDLERRVARIEKGS